MDRFFKNRGLLVGEEPPKRISTPAGQRLSVILENVDGASHRNPGYNKRGPAPGKQINSNTDDSQSSSQLHPNDMNIDREKQFALRRNKHFAKRGGWKRLVLIALLLLLLIAGLVVGLVVGLRSRHSKSSGQNGDSSSPGSAGAQDKDFPEGQYSMVTFLDTIQTNCTSIPETWTCFPFHTYNDNQATSMATFNWIIKKNDKTGTYSVSASANPFSIMFDETPMDLIDQGQETERYTFRMTTTTKSTSPPFSLSDDGNLPTCFYNDTTFQAQLYTKEARTYPPDNTKVGTAYKQWPSRIRIEQVVGGGENTPNCYKTLNGNIGERVYGNLKPQDPGNLCSCLYRNWHI